MLPGKGSMDRAMISVVFALLFPFALTTVSEEQRASCRTLYPPYAISADEAQYVSDPYGDDTWDGRMFASKHSNGGDSLEMLRLSINQGHGWPPHRHLEGDEWIYVISGEGSYAYWALEEAQPTELSIGPGHALFNPQGQLHKVWNTGPEPLLLLSVSKALSPYEVLGDWPDTPGGGLGYVPRVAPWELSCAPGHEPEQGDAAPESWDQGNGDASDWAGEEAAAALEELLLAGEDDIAAAVPYGDDYASSPEDYTSTSCGCGGDDGEHMSKDDIASCMAEPEHRDWDAAEYDEEAYGGEYGGGEDEEPEFFVEQWADEAPSLGREDGEL